MAGTQGWHVEIMTGSAPAGRYDCSSAIDDVDEELEFVLGSASGTGDDLAVESWPGTGCRALASVFGGWSGGA